MSQTIEGGPPGLRPADLELIARAKAYPYEAPDQSFLVRDGVFAPFAEAKFENRLPIIAHGSNRAPQQITRKFAEFPGGSVEIPVTYCLLDDYDVVYSAHIARYGSIPSTLQHCPGCRVRLAITWLTPEQLAWVHESEGNYVFGSLEGVGVEVEDWPESAAPQLFVYLGKHGCLAVDRQPVAVSAVSAENRRFQALDQEAAQSLVRDVIAPAAPLDRFILRNIGERQVRSTRSDTLKHRSAVPVEAPHFRDSGQKTGNSLVY